MSGTKHGRPSLSKSALLMSPCLRWADPTSEHYDEVYVDGDEISKRDLGTLFHTAMDVWVKTGHLDAVTPQLSVWLEKATAWFAAELRPRCSSIESEVPVGINWSTGAVERETEPGAWTDRNYPDWPGWYFGTADLLCKLLNGDTLVADWKTGGSEGATEQLMSLACGLARTSPEAHILCIQVNDEGVWPYEQTVSVESLQAHWDAMAFATEDIGTEKSREPKPGIHCTTLYCPHLAYCPAISDCTETLAQQAGYIPPGRLILKVTGRPDSDEEAGASMALVSASKRQTKYVETQLKEYVRNGGTVRDGNFVWSEGNNGWRWRKA